jgi:hypothetical protein
MSGETAFPEKGPLFKNPDHRFFTLYGDGREFDPAFLDIEYGIGRIPL